MNLIVTLGWTLIHFLWQGTLIALLLAALNGLLGRTASRARYAASCVAMLLMLACTVATFMRLNATPPVSSDLAAPAVSLAMPQHATANDSPAASASNAQFTKLLPWFVYFWMSGVCLLAIRSLGGWVVLRRLTRRDARPIAPIWQQRMECLAQRLQISRAVKLCESAIAEVPAVVGWMRPVVLLPACALSGLQPDQLEALLAHELAHIRRNDYLINLLQTCVETLLFYHPAVWWVGGQIRSERENCCDDLAVEVCGNALAYARALTQLEQLRCGLPQLAMAANRGSLLHRIQRLVPSPKPARTSSAGWIAAAAMTLIAIVSWASPRLARSSSIGQSQDSQPTVAISQNSPTVSGNLSPAPRAAGVAKDDVKLAPPAAPVILATATGMSEPTPEPQAQSEAQPQPQPNPSQSKGAGLVEELDRAGYHNLTVDQLVEMKIHGIDANYIRGIRAKGYEPNLDQLVAFKIHGITPEYIDQLQSRGWKLNADQLVAFRIHGVAPGDLEKMSALGYKLDADQAVAMRIHGVTPETVNEAKALGLGNPTFDQLLAMRIHGIDAQFMNGMKQAGVRDLNFETLVGLKIHGADPAEVKELAALGFKDLSAEELMACRIHGVTPDFIREVRQRGFKDANLEQIIKLKKFNIFDK